MCSPFLQIYYYKIITLYVHSLPLGKWLQWRSLFILCCENKSDYSLIYKTILNLVSAGNNSVLKFTESNLCLWSYSAVPLITEGMLWCFSEQKFSANYLNGTCWISRSMLVTQSLCISKYFLTVGCSSLMPVSAVGL